MKKEEAIGCAKKMTYQEAVRNTMYAKGVRYKKATRIKLHELAEIADKFVWCNNCRHCSEYYDRDGYPYWVCDEWDSGTDADGFCYHGERK